VLPWWTLRDFGPPISAVVSRDQRNTLDETCLDGGAVTEPFFQNANAAVDLFPVMNMEDMQAGMAKLH
jgi:hypothetical protein